MHVHDHLVGFEQADAVGWRLVAAGDPAFDYSPALRAARDKGDIWTRERLDLFLGDTEAMYPGGWMGSPPIRDAKARTDLLCVLGGP